MKKSLFVVALLILVTSLVFAKETSKNKTVTGWISDMKCGALHAKPGSEACVKSCADTAGLALVTDGDSRVWRIENATLVKGHEGHHVKVTGTMDEDKGIFHIEKVTMVEDSTKKSNP